MSEVNSILYLKQGYAQAVEIQLEADNGENDNIAPAPTEIIVNWKDSINDAAPLLQKTLTGGDVVWEPDSKQAVIGVTLDAADTNALVLGMVLTQVFLTIDGTEYATDMFNTKVEGTLT